MILRSCSLRKKSTRSAPFKKIAFALKFRTPRTDKSIKRGKSKKRGGGERKSGSGDRESNWMKPG